MAEADLYDRNEDGSAKDPKKFQAALRADPVRMAQLENEPEIGKVLLGDDVFALQELLKDAAKEDKKRQDFVQKKIGERTIDAQRVSATIPRDTVQLYQQLYDQGLQYGPSFRLLRNVHVPDRSDEPEEIVT